ncbi:MAG: hypothetical protein M1819_006479 [Sarea resinae]|nr:MAG: hypothetical protein M1819_006479 [Sarea resinae]
MHACICPKAYVALRLPSEQLKVIQILPNTTISIGKYGSFQANLLLGRPYHLTFEILDKAEGEDYAALRIVPASELHGESLDNNDATPADATESTIASEGDGVEYELVGENGEVVMRTNRQTIDDPSRQKMTMDEIEALKKEGTGAGKDLIAKLMLSHSGLDQKTSYSLAKYTLRKSRKYMRRFTVLPVDVPLLTRWLLNEREPMKVMELREEMLSLVGSWANIHYGGDNTTYPTDDGVGKISGGRWLIVDETGGLVVAAMAERMGILSPSDDEFDDRESNSADQQHSNPPQPESDGHEPCATSQDASQTTHQQQHRRVLGMSAPTNSLTLIHANSQPNLSLLKYFLFDPSDPKPSHPLHTHLKTLSWLQLLSPEDDTGYAEPEVVPEEILKTYKSGKRGTYFRKRRRWERIKNVIEETRAGGFDGLIVASVMNPASILHTAVPLLRGGAPVVVYSPTVEPLAELADLYSTARRAAFVSDVPDSRDLPNEDFPVNPTLLLGTTVQTARVRNWQVLPGRTHPMMTGKGGAEGYLFHALRVLPAEGKVEARGKFKRRKTAKEEDVSSKKEQSTPVDGIGTPVGVKIETTDD